VNGPPSVLVVDDEGEVRRGIVRTLTAAGHVVQDADYGHEAVRLVETRHFDVVVSDVKMPDLDGLQLLREIREQDLDVPVILITGAPDVGAAAEAVHYGAFRYLTKPVPPAELVEMVEHAVAMHQMARMRREALNLVGGDVRGAGDRAGLEATFERALDSMWLAYQPIVNASERTLYGYEALLRSAEPALPGPMAVLDAASKLGRLFELARKIRARASGEIQGAVNTAMLFVNLHPRDLIDDSLYDPAAPLSAIADRVILEITERASLDEVADLPARVTSLREMGFRIAVDDLGAGYSGLSSFAQLEPELVKLDMTLVRDVHRSRTKSKLIRSIAAVCRDLEIRLVAEGVESQEELDTLVSLGCDLLQGYHLAKPGPAFPDFRR
jgi:EAL domain-containing protein (putative c-di-GMP-specific phosphodiesterase class I)